ncbi:MAG: LamG-like jellyroll fold domain-containing protein, partial [Candidatus Methanoperedens sp.]|nr:LamG-like jellyroll fold domain-containing protein [Candidatus Methanoperedens sp.]
EYNALIYTPATATPDTVLLDDFNGATKGKGFGALTYEDSQPNLGKAVNLAKGTYIKYSFSPWYTWDGNHKWDRNEAASGVRTEGKIEMWIKPRQYSGILNFNWGDAASYPPAGHILNFGFNADGKLTYSVWGGNSDKGLVGKTTVPLNKWTRVAVSWSPNGTKLYVNGEVDASTSANVWPAFSGTVFAYLNYWGGNDLGFVDELHISKVAEPAPPTTSTITVTTNLAGASFTLTGASSYYGSGTSWSTANVPAGTYTITYGAVTGYNAPPSETKTLTAGGNIDFSGTYIPTPPTTGTISVTTNLAGATFSLKGASSYSGSGTSWSTANVPVGTYTITYGAVTGYNAPPSETKTLSAGGSIAFSGAYTPTSICKGPKEEFETALKNFRDAEDVLKDAEAKFEPQREQFESEREAFDSWVQSLTKEEKKANKQQIEEKIAELQKNGEKIKSLGQELQKVVKKFLERKIDLLIADIELLKCDVKFAGTGEALPFDASETLNKHITELKDIRTSVQQASKKQDIKSIDQKLKEIKEKFELEKRYYKGIGANNNMDIFFANTDDASVRMNEIIKKLNENNKDTSKLTGIASDFNNLMKEAKDEHKKTLDIFREHSGFDSSGMVTDIRKAQDFVRQIKEQQKDTKRLRSAIAKLREFFGETERLQESAVAGTGGAKT